MSTTIDFSKDVQARLEKLSAQTGQPAADYVRETLEAHLAELEWESDIATYAKAIRAGLVKTQPFDEVVRELGLDPEKLRAEAEADVAALNMRRMLRSPSTISSGTLPCQVRPSHRRQVFNRTSNISATSCDDIPVSSLSVRNSLDSTLAAFR